MGRTAAVEKPLPQFDKTQLAQLFGLHRNSVARRLRGVAPDGRRQSAKNLPVDTWTVAGAAPHLCDRDELLAATPEIDPENLPPDLAKDYWDAKIKEQTFYQRDGHLWPDDQVLDAFSRVFKPLATKVRAISDTLERRAGLNSRQTSVVDEVCDELLREIYQAVAEVAGEAAVIPE